MNEDPSEDRRIFRSQSSCASANSQGLPPIDILYVICNRSYRISIGELLESGTNNPTSRDSRLAYLEIPCGRREARAGNISSDPADHRRYFCRETGLALPCPSPNGGRRLDFRFLGRFREQSAR